MMIKTYASAVHGIDATTITIETDVSQGIRFSLVGLPDNAVKESQQRIEAALRLNNYKWPRQKIIINVITSYSIHYTKLYDLFFLILFGTGQKDPLAFYFCRRHHVNYFKCGGIDGV